MSLMFILLFLKICVLCGWYLLTHYNKVTQKKVNEAIERRNLAWKEAINNNDTETLIWLKPRGDFEITAQFPNLLNEHRKWLEGNKSGKQLIIFAEDLSNVNLKGVIIENAVINFCKFQRMNLKQTQFINCDLTHSLFIKCKTTDTDFSGSIMDGVRFK